ncbi:DUF1801 domain-containing protein [Chondrinema litorale]|uniref:DUF1801 domain-containing protein n=1 Tax=Chondrinema litorale TaxID=2994555 RepID=UPI0025428B66|nr:DUF1801 domain-containing protein [Chondrinema litorale]UZR93233.1 DUF1801 domain-containing protein [Chondrinema litorale]
MAKSDMKTTLNDGDVKKFINSIENEKRKKDGFSTLKIMEEVTGLYPKMWGTSIVGFGQYHYKYESGREGDFFMVGFSPRKQNLTIYIMPGFDRYETLMSKLGKYKTGKSCLYINKLEDVDMKVLKELINESFLYMKKKYDKD